jgi:hypothetical protein
VGEKEEGRMRALRRAARAARLYLLINRGRAAHARAGLRLISSALSDARDPRRRRICPNATMTWCSSRRYAAASAAVASARFINHGIVPRKRAGWIICLRPR